MKKKIAVVLIAVFSFLLLPIRANACGGFVAVRGEKVFHSIYCDDVMGAEFGKLRWFDTAEKAEQSGLKMCEKCSEYRDFYFDSEYCDLYFETSDPLLITAMELSSEYGEQLGVENGFELARDEYSGQFESEYNKGYADAKEQLESEYQKKEEDRKESNRLGELQILCVLVVAFVCIAVAGDFLSASWAAFKKKDYKSSFGEFIEKSLGSNAIAPLVIGAMFVYGIISLI